MHSCMRRSLCFVASCNRRWETRSLFKSIAQPSSQPSTTHIHPRYRPSPLHAQAWIIDTLVQAGGKCTLGRLVEVGELQQCDTVGSMIKWLKSKKVIDFKGVFLMFPMVRVCVCVCVLCVA